MNKFELIKNHIELTFDNEYLYFDCLIPDKTFEYFQNSSISRYQDYPEFYNFLFEVTSLLEQEKMFIQDNKACIAIDTFMELDFEEKFKLTLTDVVSFSIKIKDKSYIKLEDFQFKYKILDEKYKNAEIVGCFVLLNGKYHLLEDKLYSLFKTINKINSIPFDDSDRESKIWTYINDIKNTSPFTNSVLTGFFKDEEIIIPSGMTVDIKEDDKHNFEILANLCGLSDEERIEFNNSFEKLVDVQDTYTFNLNGKKARVVLSPEIKENYNSIKKSPKKIRREEDKNTILKNPTAIFKYPEVVSLDNFSDRVIDFGLYKAVASGSNPSNISWSYPMNISLYSIAGEALSIIIQDKDEKDTFSEALMKSIVEECAYFQFMDNLIPLSDININALKPFINEQQDVEALEEDETSAKGKIITLKDINGESFEVEFSKKVLDALKKQIDEIRRNYSLSGEERVLLIEDREVPLTVENIKQITKILEIHLLINEEDISYEKDILNEALMDSYCKNIIAEIPKDLKQTVITPDNREIQVKLKNHQLKGLAWMQNSYKMKEIGRSGILLADDMGLGKTLQLLSFMFWLKEQKPNYFNNENNNKPILIVAPVILLENWKNEYYRFFNETFGKPLVLHGDNLRNLRNDDGTFKGKEYYQMTENMSSPKAYLDIEEIKKHNIVITNYDTLTNYEFSLASIEWSLLVLDEAQEIKEEKTGKSRVAKALNTEFKIACTGTPVENSLTDLWNIFNFLQPEILDSKTNFRSEFNEKSMTEEKYTELQNKFYYSKPYAYILRRTKNIELKDDLPSKDIITYKVPLSDDQITEYGKLKAEMVNSETPIEVLLKMNKLSQHPMLLNSGVSTSYYSISDLINACPKFQKLIEILEKIKSKKEKVIIFCLFHELQKYLKLVLENHFNIENIDIINGSSSGTSSRQRQIDKFQKEQNTFNILILSPLAAGVGLNIVGANHVIHYGRWWNPAKENQATDRVYRIGQTKDVQVHYLINVHPDNSEKTFDENLHELVTSKIEMANNFLKPNDFDISSSLINTMMN